MPSLVRFVTLLLVLVLVCASGCGSSASPADPVAADDLHYELHPSTHELDAATLAAIADTGPIDGVVRFHGTPASLAALKPKEILLAGASPTTPRGILRQVTDVKTDNGDLVVHTRPAPVQLAFKSLHARITGKKSNLDGTLATQKMHAVSDSVGHIAMLDWQIFDQDKNPATKDDQLYIHGEAGGEVTFTVSIDLDWLDDDIKVAEAIGCTFLFPACIPDLPNIAIGASVVAEATVKVDAEGAAAKTFDTGLQTIPGTSFDLPTLAIGPVVVFASIDFVVAVSGSASSRFKAHAGITINAHTSVAIALKDGVSYIRPPSIRP